MARRALALSLLLAPLLLAQPAAASFAGANGPIAFVQSRDVWVVAPDGSGAIDLTRRLRADGEKTEETDPSVSPDGRLVAYLVESRNCAGGICLDDVYVSRTDGKGSPRPITRALSRKFKVPTGGRAKGSRRFVEFGAAAWSPDGRSLVLQCRVFRFGEEGHHFTELCMVDAKGRRIRRLTRCDCAPPGPGTRPDWSPTRDRIAWGDGRGLWTMTPGGRRLTRILDPRDTGDDRFYEQVSWAPDGTRIAFSGARRGGNGSSVYVARADGSGRLRVLAGGANDSYTRPAWSPDGSELAFHLDSSTRPDGIYRLSLATGAQTLVRSIGGSPLYLSPAWGRGG